MPDMPGHIARPRFLRLHDDYLNGSRENRRRFGLGLLAGDPIAGIYRHLGIGGAADWRHLEREFYAEDGQLSYWPYNRFGYLGQKQEILRQGALETIRVVEGLPESKITLKHFSEPWPDEPVTRRLETWWICSGSHTFEIDVLDGDTQVTMILFTPAMPFLPDNRKVKLEKEGFIWTVAHKHVLEHYLSEYRSDQSAYPKLKKPYRIATGVPSEAAEPAARHGDGHGHGGHDGHSHGGGHGGHGGGQGGTSHDNQLRRLNKFQE